MMHASVFPNYAEERWCNQNSKPRAELERAFFQCQKESQPERDPHRSFWFSQSELGLHYARLSADVVKMVDG